MMGFVFWMIGLAATAASWFVWGNAIALYMLCGFFCGAALIGLAKKYLDQI